MTTQTKSPTSCTNGYTTCSTTGTVVPFDCISEPGAYVCNWSGHLLRVPQDGVTAGRSPMINIVGTEPLTVTKISDNPYITLTKAKLVACNFDLFVNF